MSDAQSKTPQAYPYDHAVGAYYFYQGATKIFIDNATRNYFQISNGARVYTDRSTREKYTVAANGMRVPYPTPPPVPRQQAQDIAPYSSRKAVPRSTPSPAQPPSRNPAESTSSRSPEPLVGSLDSGYGTSYSTRSAISIAPNSIAKSRQGETNSVSNLETQLRALRLPPTPNTYTQRETTTAGVFEIVIRAADNQSHSTYRIGNYKGTTSNEAKKKGLQSTKLIKGTEGQKQDRIDAQYKTRVRTDKCFRAFEVIETLEADPPPQLQSYLTTVTHNSAYQQHRVRPRKWIVIENHETSCSVVAIRTYFGYGVSYQGVRKSNHMIVHSNDPRAPPQPLQAEEPRRGVNGALAENGMKVPPIAVQMFGPGAVLNPMSRVDLYRVSTIKHDRPLRDIGRVRLESRWVLQYNFWTVQLENTHQTDPRYADLWIQHQRAVQASPAPVDSVTSHIGASGTGEDEDESESSSEDDD